MHEVFQQKKIPCSFFHLQPTIFNIDLKQKENHPDDLLRADTLKQQLAACRIRAKVVQIYLRVDDAVVNGTPAYANALRKLIAEHATNTSVLFLTLPDLPDKIVKTAYTRDQSARDAILAGDEYLNSICRLTEGIPVALVRAGEKADMISTSI